MQTDATITTSTAQTVGQVIRTLASAGALPPTEAAAATAALRNAAKPKPAAAPPPKDKPGLLTRAQVAELLKCSPRNVSRMAEDGTLTRRYLRAYNAKSLRFIEAEVLALCDLPTDGEG